jgi:uncharacterized membrane protein
MQYLLLFLFLNGIGGKHYQLQLSVTCFRYLLFFHIAEKWLRNYKTWSRLMDWLFARTRKRADSKIRKYKYIGLILFVAVPLPFTGAWTGALIAYLFDLDIKKSMITIFIGVLIAAFIMAALAIFFESIFGY